MQIHGKTLPIRGNPWNIGRMSRTKAPNVSEHAAALRRAIATAGLQQAEVANALGVAPRTITNWVSRTDPTMPDDRRLQQLDQLFPGYADAGDTVEGAITHSELDPWRQADVLATYRRHLQEQQREDKALG